MPITYVYFYLNIVHIFIQKKETLASRQDADLPRRIVWTHPYAAPG